MSSTPPAARRGLTLVELLVVVAILATLVGLLLPATQKVRCAATRVGCANGLRQVGMAAAGYDAATGRLPGPGPLTALGGWSVDLLPWLEQDALDRSLRHDLPAVAPENMAATTLVRPPPYRCPAARHDPTDRTAPPDRRLVLHYAANSAVLDLPLGAVPAESARVLFQELPADPDWLFNWVYPATAGDPVPADPDRRNHPGGAHVAFLDGHVELLADPAAAWPAAD